MNVECLPNNAKVLAFVIRPNGNSGEINSSTEHLKLMAVYSLFYAEAVIDNVLVGFVSRNDYRNFRFEDEIHFELWNGCLNSLVNS